MPRSSRASTPARFFIGRIPASCIQVKLRKDYCLSAPIHPTYTPKGAINEDCPENQNHPRLVFALGFAHHDAAARCCEAARHSSIESPGKDDRGRELRKTPFALRTEPG